MLQVRLNRSHHKIGIVSDHHTWQRIFDVTGVDFSLRVLSCIILSSSAYICVDSAAGAVVGFSGVFRDRLSLLKMGVRKCLVVDLKNSLVDLTSAC